MGVEEWEVSDIEREVENIGCRMDYRGLGRKSVYECLNLRQFKVMNKLSRKSPKVNPITLEFNQIDVMNSKRAFKGPNGEVVIECNRCIRKLSPLSFHRSKYEPMGLRSICKECQKEHNRLNTRDRMGVKPYKDHQMIQSLDNHNTREIMRAKECNRTNTTNEVLNEGDQSYEILLQFDPELSSIRVLFEGEEMINLSNLHSSPEVFLSCVIAQLRAHKIRLNDTSLYYEAE